VVLLTKLMVALVELQDFHNQVRFSKTRQISGVVSVLGGEQYGGGLSWAKIWGGRHFKARNMWDNGRKWKKSAGFRKSSNVSKIPPPCMDKNFGNFTWNLVSRAKFKKVG
jgi:hypothetical protein